jgi:hypothetical protein
MFCASSAKSPAVFALTWGNPDPTDNRSRLPKIPVYRQARLLQHTNNIIGLLAWAQDRAQKPTCCPAHQPLFSGLRPTLDLQW